MAPESIELTYSLGTRKFSCYMQLRELRGIGADASNGTLLLAR